MHTALTSWEIKNPAKHPKLDREIEADVAIIGGGITGIFNAYVLAKAGLKVVVLEKNEHLLQNATLRTTGFITKLIDTPFDRLVSMFGKERADLVWESGQEAIELIADSVKNENIDCEFSTATVYTYASNNQQFKKLTREYHAVRTSGFEAQLESSGAKLPFENHGFMEVPGQAKFHPLAFAEGLAKAAERAGAQFFAQSEVIAIDGTTVKTKTGEVRAKDVLIATYSPFTNEGTRFRKAKYISYVYELEIAKNVIPEGMYLDMHNPYHYFRVDHAADFDRMIIGGEDHREDIKINPEKNFHALDMFAKHLLKHHAYTVKHAWHGRMLESIDGLPLIGEIKPHTYVATAFSGNGMTYAPISALMMRSALLGKSSLYADLYSPKRIPSLKQLTLKGLDYGAEMLGGAVKNFFLLPKKK